MDVLKSQNPTRKGKIRKASVQCAPGGLLLRVVIAADGQELTYLRQSEDGTVVGSEILKLLHLLGAGSLKKLRKTEVSFKADGERVTDIGHPEIHCWMRS